MNDKCIQYVYTFAFSDGTTKDFEINLDDVTLELIPKVNAPKPGWTKLKFCQCANCPLSDDVEHCPAAVNLAAVVETFQGHTSHETVIVTVKTNQRTYQKELPLQKGLSSITGMCLVTSNCPILDNLRANVRYHLPFASSEETVYRQVAMYLTQQYFIMRDGGEPDWNLHKLKEVYGDVLIVNKGLSDRLAMSSTQDANVNAMIILASFGQFLDSYLEDSLLEIKSVFSHVPNPHSSTH